MTTIHYPVKGRKPSEVFTQKTFDLLMSQWEAWQQGPGVIGRLNLHACWGTSSVLDRSYQGETTTILAGQMRIYRRLYEHTKNPKWRVKVNAIASHLLYLQDDNGGFIHATAEFEPSFDTRGCPIHFFYPVIALCEYYLWDYADEDIKALIPSAVDRHWEWSLKASWMVGNGFKHPLDFPGWCGVTNQDFTAVAALAMGMKAFSNKERYEQYALPVLEHYLSPAYYHEKIGLFERGDGKNFAERSVYYSHIFEMLELIYNVTGDRRLYDAYHNVAAHLFDAAFVAKDGLTYLARGAITDPVDKSKVLGWEYDAIAFDHYPKLMQHMQKHLNIYPDAAKQEILERLRETLAAYVFVDGTLPMGLLHKNPLFEIVSTPGIGWYEEMVMDYLGDALQDPMLTTLPAFHRHSGNMAWKQNGRLWSIEENGERKYGGYTRYVAGIVKGADAQPVLGRFDALENPEYIEIIDKP